MGQCASKSELVSSASSSRTRGGVHEAEGEEEDGSVSVTEGGLPTGESTASTAQLGQPRIPPEDRVPDLAIQLTHLRPLKHLADGGFCTVYRGTRNGEHIVVKSARLDIPCIEETLHDLETELEILKGLRHENIVTLVGAGHAPHRFIVLERLSRDTLAHVLGTEASQVENLATTVKRRQLLKQFPLSSAVHRAKELASALDYMHAKAHPNVMLLHRDIKPVNIGFSLHARTLKLMDFGLARLVERRGSDELYSMTGETGSMRYMAPEVARHERYNEKSDIFSFGLILWEMITLRRPFEGMEEAGFVRGVVNGDLRPKIPVKIPPEVTRIVELCWSGDATTRPSAAKCLQMLDKLEVKTPQQQLEEHQQQYRHQQQQYEQQHREQFGGAL